MKKQQHHTGRGSNSTILEGRNEYVDGPGTHCVVADVHQDGVAHHGSPCIDQLSNPAELDGADANAFLGLSELPIQCTARTSAAALLRQHIVSMCNTAATANTAHTMVAPGEPPISSGAALTR